MMTLKEIVWLLVNGDNNAINENTIASDKEYMTFKDMKQDNDGNMITTKKSKYVNYRGLKLGLQNTNDNLDTSDPSTSANVKLAEAETIAYPIFKCMQEMEKEIQELKQEIWNLRNGI